MDSKNKDLYIWLFLFGIFFAAFHILPALLSGFMKKPLTYGDVLDFLTPIAVITTAYVLYSRIFRINSDRFFRSRLQKISSKTLLGLGFFLYVDGHGLHLAANSIARLIEKTNNPELFDAVYLFDESISHFMLDGGIFLISLSLIMASYRISSRLSSPKNFFFLLLGACFYGFTFTVNSIEGQTVVLFFPAAFLGLFLSVGLYVKELKSEMKNPLLQFFFMAYLLSLLLFLFWGITKTGFPQFSELGWI